jgi:hypothetical protein
MCPTPSPSEGSPAAATATLSPSRQSAAPLTAAQRRKQCVGPYCEGPAAGAAGTTRLANQALVAPAVGEWTPPARANGAPAALGALSFAPPAGVGRARMTAAATTTGAGAAIGPGAAPGSAYAVKLAEIVPAPGEWAVVRRGSGDVAARGVAPPLAAEPGACTNVSMKPDARRSDLVRLDFSGRGMIHALVSRTDVRGALAGTCYDDTDLSRAQVLCVPQGVVRRLEQLGTGTFVEAASQLRRSSAGWVLSADARR